MMGPRWLAGSTLAAAICAVLLACGGGSGGASGSTSSNAGTTAASSASGLISGFGSVIVNGSEYRVDGNTSVVDGDTGARGTSTEALLVGMRVNVEADGLYASQIEYTSAVRGEVDAIDGTNSTITVLGQTVVVSSATAFAGSTTSAGTTSAVTALANLAVGDYVVVYGYLECTSSSTTSGCTGGTTQVLASLVYVPTVTGVYRVEGYAENVDTASGSFAVNGLVVDYTSSGSSATSCAPSPCAPTNGAFVAVSSSSAPGSSAGTLTLAASRIETAALAPVLVVGSTVTLAGPVAALDTSAATFSLLGVPVAASALAGTVDGLADNQIVQVTGTVNADGSITASAIVVEQQATFTLDAPLSAQSASADTLVVLGQTFTLTSSTRFIDLAGNVRPFNLSNFSSVLSVGDQLVVSGYAGSSGNVATRVERIPLPATAYVAVQGIVTADSLSADTLTIGGVAVSLTSATTLSYPGSGSSTTLAAFIDAIAVDSSVVAATGTAGSTSASMNASSAGLLSAGCSWANSD